MQIMGDLAFKYMDVPGAEAISERIKKTIPPEILEDEDGEEVDPQVQQMQQMVEQAQQEMTQMQEEYAQMEQQLKDKQGELQIKAMSEQNKSQADQGNLAIKEAELALKEKELELKELEIVGRLQNEQEKLEQAHHKLHVENDLKIMEAQTPEIDESQSLGNEANVYNGETNE